MRCYRGTCREEALFWLVAGCLEALHVTEYPACLGHMIAVRSGYTRPGEKLFCLACLQAGRSGFVDDLAIVSLAGQEVEIQ